MKGDSIVLVFSPLSLIDHLQETCPVPVAVKAGVSMLVDYAISVCSLKRFSVDNINQSSNTMNAIRICQLRAYLSLL